MEVVTPGCCSGSLLGIYAGWYQDGVRRVLVAFWSEAIKPHAVGFIWNIPKLRVPYFGVLIIRIQLLMVLY